MEKIFTASRLLDTLSPDEVIFSDKGVTFRHNKVFGGSESFVFYSDISGIEIDNGLFYATIRILPRARPEIVIENFTKEDAREIKRLIMERV